MKYEDKEILLKDLCARLPYDVVVELDEKFGFNKGTRVLVKELLDLYCVEGMKPYLRPMSSMTVEEKEELLIYVLDNKEGCKQFKINDKGAIESIDNNIFQWVNFNSDTTSRYIDWLNKKMFDYRGLIPKGLAIKVTEENNPYK